ncbi:MAG: hypothetical protein JO287_14900 [Pseudonocardiales bacterium]|nr:hypothetical protein [Pseudonocardiales bacterium]
MLIPIYIFYSMFGFQRTSDGLWAAGDTLVTPNWQVDDTASQRLSSFPRVLPGHAVNKPHTAVRTASPRD